MRTTTESVKQIGEYRLIQLIGRGGMGEVWLASRVGMKKPCALKLLLPRYSRNPDYRRRFFREAEILASLRYRCIVPVLDIGEADGHLYISMEYIDGVNLDTLVRAVVDDGLKLPTPVVAYIAGEIFEALRHAHNRTFGGEHLGVMHLDVTPRNVLISSEGEVFLTDFGIALRETDVSVHAFGTLQYMAPEQALGRAELRSDLFGACGVLHFLLTGEPPRKVFNLADLQRVMFDPPTSLPRTDVPEPLVRLRNKGLTVDVAERLSAASDGLQLLRQYDGYRSQTTVLADIYLRYIGAPRSGWTGMLPVATGRSPEGQDSRMTADIGPRDERGHDPMTRVEAEPASTDEDSSDDRWYRRWADTGPLQVDAEGEPNAPRRIDPDAPRLFRRPHLRKGSPGQQAPLIGPPKRPADTDVESTVQLAPETPPTVDATVVLDPAEVEAVLDGVELKTARTTHAEANPCPPAVVDRPPAGSPKERGHGLVVVLGVLALLLTLLLLGGVKLYVNDNPSAQPLSSGGEQ